MDNKKSHIHLRVRRNVGFLRYFRKKRGSRLCQIFAVCGDNLFIPIERIFPLPALLVQFLRDVVEALGDRTSNTGQGVAAAAKGNGGTNSIGHPVNLLPLMSGMHNVIFYRNLPLR